MKSKQTKNLAHPKNNYDLFIAAIALEYGKTLVTSNVKDYMGIPNLELYQPS
jgi:predicted nucleic acid-binding protein